jgi:hypothetical protein
MRKFCFILLLLASLAARAAAQPAPDGLDRLLAPDRLPVLRTQRMLQASSYDREGGNNDGFDGAFSTLREENGEFVFFEATGPGVIYRIWTASYHGNISVYFDGESEPSYHAPMSEFLGGHTPPLRAPLCQFASGGLCCYFPLEYEKSIKLTLDEKPLFFHVDYAAAEDPAHIVSSTPRNLAHRKDAVDRAADLLANRGTILYHGPVKQTPFNAGLAPGQTLEIWGEPLPGAVQGLYVNPLNTQPADFKKITIRMYWDGAPTPAVDVSLLRFFAMDFGYEKYRSLFMGFKDDSFYSFFPMPFRDKARIELENTGDNPVRIQGLVQLAPGTFHGDFGYFHAANRTMVSEQDKPILVNEISGARGHWVGAAVSAIRPKGEDDIFRCLEGDEHVYIDGGAEPIWSGTGTEDYFNGGWYFSSDPFSRALHGAPVMHKKRSAIVMYRVHLTDAVPFNKSIRFEFEHGGHNDQPGVLYDVVSYWYQATPEKTGL